MPSQADGIFVGEVVRSVPIASAPLVRADAALVRIDGDIRFRRKTDAGSIGRQPFDITAQSIDINDNIPVMKVGASTGLTTGTLACQPELLSIPNQALGRSRPHQPVYMVLGDDQHADFGAPGDSGAIVFDEDLRPVGLLVAMYYGGSRPRLGVCIPIRNVLSELRASL